MHQVWFPLIDRFQLLDVCGPLQVFATVNDELRLNGKPPFYETRTLAMQAGLVRSSSGAALEAQALPARPRSWPDTLIVPGGAGAWNPFDETQTSGNDALVAWTRRAAPRVKRLASVCTGAFVLAHAGALDGRRAVTHWAACESLRAAFPAIDVQEDAIYFRDGNCWTSAGVTAGIDMALGMVEADVGREVAMSVAKKLVVFYKRPGGQSQFSSALLEQTAGDERIAHLHAWARTRLRQPLDVPALAERLAMTPRTFARFYVQQTGNTPARGVTQLRLERACRMIEAREGSMKAVAHRCGFSSEEVMRRAFVRHLHVSPQEYRHRFSGD